MSFIFLSALSAYARGREIVVIDFGYSRYKTCECDRVKVSEVLLHLLTFNHNIIIHIIIYNHNNNNKIYNH